MLQHRCSSSSSINVAILVVLVAAFHLFVAQTAQAISYYSRSSSSSAAGSYEESCANEWATDSHGIRLHNWGGNFNFSTQDIQYPRSIGEVQTIVRRAKKLRVLGSRHSFSTIADSQCTILSTLGLNRVLRIDASVPSVTVQGGIPYEDLAISLDSVGYALESLAALVEITVAGATQTGTHGSGLSYGGLATQIRSLQLVKADGTLERIGPDDARLKAVAVGLGAFGVITEVELRIEPAYNLTRYMYQNMPTQNVLDHFDEIEAMGYNVMLINTFTNAPDIWDTVMINVRSDAPNDGANLGSELFGATLASKSVELWYQGHLITNFGLSATDGDQIQTEHFVPISNAVPAIKAVLPFFERAEYKSLVIGLLVRTIRGDDLWMSEVYGDQTMVAIHFSWQNNLSMLKQRLLPPIDQALLPFGAHPHWGKVFTMRPRDFLPHYPMLAQWKKLAREMDPNGKFRNAYLDENVFISLKGAAAAAANRPKSLPLLSANIAADVGDDDGNNGHRPWKLWNTVTNGIGNLFGS